MNLFIKAHPYHYEAENLCRVFFPFDRVTTVRGDAEYEAQSRNVYTEIRPGDEPYFVRIEDESGARTMTGEKQADDEYGLMALLFKALSAHTGKVPRWGMLTGIHPIKLLRQLTEKFGSEEANRLFREKYFVSEEKAAIASRTLASQLPVTNDVGENDFSLYISVPFCPTRCAYCSFVSQSVEKAKKQIPEYHKLMLEEIRETAAIANGLGLTLRSVYVGGGTPTTFSAEQLSEMIAVVREVFDLSHCDEFTVEAGSRPRKAHGAP